MTTQGLSVLPVSSHRSDRRLVDSMDKAVLALHAMERLEELSSDILDRVQEGESYEALVRSLVCLDHNLRSLGTLAHQARVVTVIPADAHQRNHVQQGVA